MKRIRIYNHGGPEMLTLEEADAPALGPDAVLVQQEFIGVNFSDIQARVGGSIYASMPLPRVPGVEGAGTVIAVGDQVEGISVGDRVGYFGSFEIYAEIVAVPQGSVVRLPPQVTTQQAASVLTQGSTAWILAYEVLPALGSEHTVLLHAAAGGVGSALLQLLKRQGVTVITTVSNDEKAELVRSLGADHVIDYAVEDFVSGVRSITDGIGVDVVFDGVGLTTFDGSLASLRPKGTLMMLGEASGPPPMFAPARLGHLGSLQMTRVLYTDYRGDDAQKQAREHEVLDAMANDELRVHLGGVFPFAEAGRAHELLGSRASLGKILLDLS